MSRSTHAARRSPATPSEPLDLSAVAETLLAEARELQSQRSARTLTPGAGAPVKQTLLALIAGQHLEEHPAPGPTTLQAVTGRVVLRHDGEAVELHEGAWMACPTGPHTLEAASDSVVLLTVGQRSDDESMT